MHHFLLVAAQVLDEGEPLQVGKMKTKNVAEVSEDNEVSEATLCEDTRSTGQHKSKFSLPN